MNIFSKAYHFLFPGAKTYPKVGAGKMALLGLQQAFAMSCATILVPILTGLDVGVADLAPLSFISVRAAECRPSLAAPLLLSLRCKPS